MIHPRVLPVFLRRPFRELRLFVRNVSRVRIVGLASEAAFWLFSSLLPLAAAFGMLAAKIARDDWAIVAPLVDGVPNVTADLVRTELAKVAAWNGGSVGPVAALTFLWLASSGIDGLLDAFDVIYGTKGELQRPVWRRRLAAMGFTLFACVSLGATAWVARALPYWDWVVWLAGLALGVALVAALFWLGTPKRHDRGRRILPGAVAAVTLHAIFGRVIQAYVTTLGDGSAYSAGLAGIGVTLLGMFFVCLALLLGLAINRQIDTRVRWHLHCKELHETERSRRERVSLDASASSEARPNLAAPPASPFTKQGVSP